MISNDDIKQYVKQQVDINNIKLGWQGFISSHDVTLIKVLRKEYGFISIECHYYEYGKLNSSSIELMETDVIQHIRDSKLNQLI